MTDPSAPGQRPATESAATSAAETTLRILGDLVYPDRRPAPTSALLSVLDDAGVSADAARRALTRTAEKGLIAGSKVGRTVQWELTARGEELMRDGNRRAAELASPVPPWAGSWFVLVVTVPHSRRAVRQKLYKALQWAGCGMPMPGVWVNVRPERESTIAGIVERVGLEQHSVSFTGPAGSVGLSDVELVARAWDLGAVERSYRAAVVDLAEQSVPDSGPAAIRQLLHVDRVLHTMIPLDPVLPDDLCPESQSRIDAGRLVERRRSLLAVATAYWTELTALGA